MVLIPKIQGEKLLVQSIKVKLLKQAFFIHAHGLFLPKVGLKGSVLGMREIKVL